ncbi:MULTISPECIES: PLP-dependent aminotransferase family protein [unclassified Polaromonas]|jgi:DNA-binding transcriptional MocR family regulator|uniref:aminotransferase-like domain-containing protein n=1 Tax=unclassified Polaromonas TaxID=2638319 RepID=UPI000BD26E0E|nr:MULTISPECIES: PLP-dependent aminotransferase family protein [unclassified Polaromonas]OYY34321.1 MAG: GntR family transcriptional regulator [Polaromonas sp. 35-63-35]OYZ17821.1 MAG: GntR family transcriptional regulator [Polaromonas sp. 16-63-31]OYZ77220.1 MAG: GntR family transcriptional regulator [Polaromonas sp. 24-63-21]OZA48151.1 MAG: GntR family transcriptional regulator [Polaromonas sp. 17-63-33]OZA86678.1 MAG: GntR family transcriptional regulator [Polaromonas sp. 39-63-25]
MLMKTASQSLTEQLSARFAERIRSRLLAPGARLPSVRLCAEQQGVSVSTVVAAYDQLQAQGLVVARRNRGFFVRDASFNAVLAPAHSARVATKNGATGALEASAPDTPAPLSSWSTATWMASRQAPVDATALIRGMFHKVSNKPQPGMGVFPTEWLETSFMPAAVRRVTSGSALREFSLSYGEPMGDSGLRRALSQKLSALNVHALPEQIITSVGATHALDIVSRTLLRAGDCVMVEEPGWAVEFARLDALGMRILPVPRRADGPDLEVMAQYCALHSPKLFVSVSVFHNPTGYCLTPGSAHRVLQLANQHNFHIVEDDTYSHLAPEHATRLCALDGLQRTIYVSGFAKILAPGWRVGFMAAPPDLVERLLDTKLLGTLTTPSLLEKALAWCIDQGQLRRHAERIRTRLDAARARSVKLALAHGCSFAAEPAGLFGWVETGVDTDALAQRMLDEGYLIAPGALFHAVRKPSTLMRINFATTQEAAFWKVFARLRDSMK